MSRRSKPRLAIPIAAISIWLPLVLGCGEKVSSVPESGIHLEHETPQGDEVATTEPWDDESDFSPASRPLFVEFQLAMRARDYEAAAAALARIGEQEPENTRFHQFHAHHVGYNIAAEMDDPADFYHWKRRAILVLADEYERNPSSLTLLSDLGWYVGMLGKANRGREMRRRFAADESLHERIAKYVDLKSTVGPEGLPDNVLVAKLLAQKAIELSESSEAFPDSISPLLLCARPSMLQASYAWALQEDGYFGRAAPAWKEAKRMFEQLAQREMPLNENWRGRMADLPQWRAKKKALWMHFDEKYPALRQRLFEEAIENLPSELEQGLRDAAEVGDWDPDLEDIERELMDMDAAALAIAREAAECAQRIQDINRNRLVVQLDEWLARCEIEQATESMRVRQLLFRAREAREAGHFESDSPENPGARQLYEEAFRRCADNLREHPQWAENYLYWNDIILETDVAMKAFGSDIMPPVLTGLRQKWAP